MHFIIELCYRQHKFSNLNCLTFGTLTESLCLTGCGSGFNRKLISQFTCLQSKSQKIFPSLEISCLQTHVGKELQGIKHLCYFVNAWCGAGHCLWSLILRLFSAVTVVFTYHRLVNLSHVSFSLLLFQISLEWNLTEDATTILSLEMVSIRNYPRSTLSNLLWPVWWW